MVKWLTFYFNKLGGGGGHFSTLKFDPIFNDFLNLVETDQIAYISFQQVKKGGGGGSILNVEMWPYIIIIYFTYRTLTVKNGELAYISFQYSKYTEEDSGQLSTLKFSLIYNNFYLSILIEQLRIGKRLTFYFNEVGGSIFKS